MEDEAEDVDVDPAPQHKPAPLRQLGPKKKTWRGQSITVGRAAPGEVKIVMCMAHDVGLHATKVFILHPIKKKIVPSFLTHSWVVSKRSLVS